MALIGLRDLITELVEQLRDVIESANLEFPVQIEPGMVLNPSPPTIDVYFADPPRDERAAAFNDLSGGYLVTVRARVLTADNDAGQDLLLSLLDDTDDLSILAAVLDDPTLNGKGNASYVSGSGHRLYETPDGGAHLGAEWTFLLIPARS